jgi:hypothetical protein
MKYISILILSILLASCGSDTDTNTVTIPVDEYKQLKGDTVKPEYPREVYWIGPYGRNQKSYVFKIENHEYLIGNYGNYDDRRTFYMVHYPDCKFCKKDSLK